MKYDVKLLKSILSRIDAASATSVELKQFSIDNSLKFEFQEITEGLPTISTIELKPIDD